MLTSVAAVAVSLLQALSCPACWSAYAGLLSSMGVGFFNYTPYLLPVMAGLLAISVLVLIIEAQTNQRYVPLL